MMAPRVFRPLVDTLVQGHIWIGLGTLCMGLHTYSLIDVTVRLSPFWLLLFVGTVFSYTLMRTVRVRRVPEILPSIRQAWGAVLAFSGLATMWAMMHIPGHLWPWMLLGAGGALLYILPIGGGRRFRDIPFFKVFYISLLWTYATFILPAVHAGEVIPLAGIAGRFFFLLGITLPFDIRDMELDRREGVCTIPLWLGWQKTRRLAIGFLGASLMLDLVQIGRQGAWESSAWMANAITLLVAAILVSYVHPQRPKRFYDLGLDGMLILPWLLNTTWQGLR